MRKFTWTSEMQGQDLSPFGALQTESKKEFSHRGNVRTSSPAAFSLELSGAILFATAAFLLLLAAPRASYSASDSFYHVREVKPNVYVWVAEDVMDDEGDPQFSRAGNAGFIITPDGVVVIDTTNSPFNARALLYEIRQRTDLPVRYVINTGATPDVMLGNESFADFKPVILATPSAALAMRQYRNEFPVRIEGSWQLEASMRGIHPTPANQTFNKEMAIPLPGQPIKVISLGHNTAPGDAAVYLPQSKVLFLGDVYENEYVPRLGSADITHWLKTLKKIESWNVDVYVPGHGQPSGKAQVQDFGHFLEWLSGQVHAGMQKGMTLQQIQNDLVPFQNFHWHAPELETEAVASVYHLLKRQSKEVTSTAKAAIP